MTTPFKFFLYLKGVGIISWLSLENTGQKYKF